jgi:formate-dependent nitrite reductase membrane component NrfD
MPSFNPASYNRKSVGTKRMNGCGSFLLGNTLGGLQEADGTMSAYSGKGLGMGLGMGMCGMGMSVPKMSGLGMGSINKKLESLMVKQSKPKPKNIKFNI